MQPQSALYFAEKASVTAILSVSVQARHVSSAQSRRSGVTSTVALLRHIAQRPSDPSARIRLAERTPMLRCPPHEGQAMLTRRSWRRTGLPFVRYLDMRPRPKYPRTSNTTTTTMRIQIHIALRFLSSVTQRV